MREVKGGSADVGGEAVAVPQGCGIRTLGGRHTVVGTIAVDSQDEAIFGFVVEHVRIKDSGVAAARSTCEEAGESGWSLENVPSFVIDFEGHVDHGDDVVRTDSQLGIRRHIQSASTAVVGVEAIEGDAHYRSLYR